MNLELEGTGHRPGRVHLNAFETPFVKPYQLPFTKFTSILNSDRFLKFAFVRNPYTRLLSCYLDKIVNNKPQKGEILRSAGYDPEILDRYIEFEEFVTIVGQQEPKDMNHHWRIQRYQLFSGYIDFHYIGAVESLPEDIRNVDNCLGGVLKPHYEDVLWHKTDAAQRIAKYFNDNVASKIAAKYATDFEVFGYSRDWRALL
jgi:hypothetical protein